jgi:hypothetical protein
LPLKSKPINYGTPQQPDPFSGEAPNTDYNKYYSKELITDYKTSIYYYKYSPKEPITVYNNPTLTITDYQ